MKVTISSDFSNSFGRIEYTEMIATTVMAKTSQILLMKVRKIHIIILILFKLFLKRRQIQNRQLLVFFYEWQTSKENSGKISLITRFDINDTSVSRKSKRSPTRNIKETDTWRHPDRIPKWAFSKRSNIREMNFQMVVYQRRKIKGM